MSALSGKPLAVVTGGSSGIGYELAKHFARNNWDVIIAAQNPQNLAKAARDIEALGAQVTQIAVDLSTHEGNDELYRQVKALGRPVEAVVLNAGVGVGGEFTKTNLQEEMKIIDLNCMHSVHTTKLFINDLVAQGHGYLLFAASVAGIMPTPFEAVYGATKAFVLSFAESLHNELKDTGVKVTAFLPGATETNFFHRAHMDNTKVGQGEKDTAADVAKRAFDAMIAGVDKQVVGGAKVKVQAALAAVLPETTKAGMHRDMAEPGSAKK